MNDHDTAAVSVIIPCFCCTKTIKRAVESVYKQTLRPAEVILIDDYSDDDTLEFLYEVQSKYPSGWVTIISLPENSGPGSARNVGWERASQSFIAFLDADDAWFPQKIKIQYQWLINHPEVVLTGHANVVCLDGEQAKYNDGNFASPHKVGLTRLLLSNRFITPSVMVKRDVIHRFPEKVKYAEDYSLWLRIVASGGRAYRFDEALAILYKRHYGESGLSSNIWAMEKGELECFVELYKSGLIGVLKFVFVILFSLMKFSRRLIKVYSRKLINFSPFKIGV